jgi:hypothetical protein
MTTQNYIVTFEMMEDDISTIYEDEMLIGVDAAGDALTQIKEVLDGICHAMVIAYEEENPDIENIADYIC